MENTITGRRVSYKVIAFTILFIAVALLVGFAAGRVSITPATASVRPTTQPEPVVEAQAATVGWAYHYDSLMNKWYARHYVMTYKGLGIDGNYELSGRPEDRASGCGLNRNEPDC